MSNMDDIRQAIIVLRETAEQDSTPGPWLVDQHEPAIWTSGEDVAGGTICYINTDQQTGGHRPQGDAEMIVMLHRTVPAVLSILEVAEAYGDLGEGEGSRFILAATVLARAILGKGN